MIITLSNSNYNLKKVWNFLLLAQKQLFMWSNSAIYFWKVIKYIFFYFQIKDDLICISKIGFLVWKEGIRSLIFVLRLKLFLLLSSASYKLCIFIITFSLFFISNKSRLRPDKITNNTEHISTTTFFFKLKLRDLFKV